MITHALHYMIDIHIETSYVNMYTKKASKKKKLREIWFIVVVPATKDDSNASL